MQCYIATKVLESKKEEKAGGGDDTRATNHKIDDFGTINLKDLHF